LKNILSPKSHRLSACNLFQPCSSLARSRHGGRSNGGGSSSDSSGGCGLLFQHCPVESVVVLVVQGSEEDPEQLSEIHVVGSLFEAKTSAVVQIHGKLCGESLAENFNRCWHFLLTNFLVLLFLGGGLESLPGQTSSVEVHQDVAQRLHVVTSALFNTEMGVDGGVPGSSGQVLVLPVRNVLSSSVISVLLC